MNNKSNNQPEEKRVQFTRQTTAIFSGPIPPAQELSKYEEVLPGSAERIIIMAEKQAGHRQFIENQLTISNIRSKGTGQKFALFITIIAIISATIAALYGKQTFACVLGGSTLVGLAGVFVYGSEYRKKEEQQSQ